MPLLDSHRPIQLMLPFPQLAGPHAAADRFASDLQTLIGGRLRVRIHNNRSTMVSLRRAPDALELRVHRMFVAAEPEVVRALADYARAQSPQSSEVLDLFVRRNRDAIRPRHAPLGGAPLRPQGSVHDLRAIFDSLNSRYFDGAIQAQIGWGRGTGERARRSMRMGVYLQESRTILVHPALDAPAVPRYFVELVVYHEMLHQAVPQQRTHTGRRSVHSREFRRRESQFADFAAAREWERRNVNALLRPPG